MWLALALGVITIPVILATGSRAGILLTLASLALTFAVFSTKSRRRGDAVQGRYEGLLRIGIPALLLVMVAATWQFGRALSIQRLTGAAPAAGVDEELRFRFAPLVVRIVRQTFPTGTGFGSFDPVFRQYEPDEALKNTVFNHAHNELLELAMTGGIAALLLLGVFLIWWAMRVLGAVRLRPQTRTARFVLLGGSITAILMGSSIVDYPLRTPLLEAWFAIACGWLCTGLNARPAAAASSKIAVAPGQL